jgi:hypothetical protein
LRRFFCWGDRQSGSSRNPQVNDSREARIRAIARPNTSKATQTLLMGRAKLAPLPDFRHLGRLLLSGCLARVALRTAVRPELGALPSRRCRREALRLALQRRCGLALGSLSHYGEVSAAGR